MTTTEVSSLVKQYREAQQLAEMAKAEAEAAKAALLDELNHRGVDRLDAGTYKVTVTTVTSSRIDTKALKAAAPELAERFSKEIVTQRFNVR